VSPIPAVIDETASHQISPPSVLYFAHVEQKTSESSPQ